MLNHCEYMLKQWFIVVDGGESCLIIVSTPKIEGFVWGRNEEHHGRPGQSRICSFWCTKIWPLQISGMGTAGHRVTRCSKSSDQIMAGLNPQGW